MKRFKCVVTQEKEYIVELDENVLNDDYLKEFSDYFYDFNDLSDHAEYLAKFQAVHGDSFIEGYGDVLRNGKLPLSLSNKDIKAADGINIVIIDEDYIDVSLEEI